VVVVVVVVMMMMMMMKYCLPTHTHTHTHSPPPTEIPDNEKYFTTVAYNIFISTELPDNDAADTKAPLRITTPHDRSQNKMPFIKLGKSFTVHLAEKCRDCT
jgi:hypothetical protein